MREGGAKTLEVDARLRVRHGLAWVALCLALAVHVTDEALTGFLPFYNSNVLAVREHLPFLRLPTFTFEVWLTGLVEAIIVLLALSPFAFYGKRFMATLSFPFALVMLFNGLLHVAGAIYFGRLVPGLFSSPLLLAGATYLLVTTHGAQRRAD